MANSRELWNRLEVLLDAATVAVSGCGTSVGWVGMQHGDLIVDECCEVMLYMRVIRTNVADPFPNATQAPTNCAQTLATLVELGIVRCAPMMDDNGNPPSAEAQTEFVREVIRDKSILFNVIMQHNPDWANYPLVISAWNPVNIEGGCGGGAWQFFIDTVLCPCGPTDV